MIDNNNTMKFGYEDTDRKVELEIYGLKFEFDFITKDIAEKMINIKEDNIMELLNVLVGEERIDKINKKRVQDGYKEIDEIIAMQLIAFIVEKCTISKFNDVVDNIKNRTDNINSINFRNREDRRNYKHNKKRYNKRNWR